MGLRAIVVAFGLAACAAPPGEIGTEVRFATFNVALASDEPGEVRGRLEQGLDAALAVAEIVEHVHPDVLLLNEVDYDATGRVVELLRTRYFAARFDHVFTAPVNTGVPSGFDLDRDGRTDGPGDALGYGHHPGQYGMVLFSRYPILRDRVRTFRELPWRAMPGARIPDGWYPPAALEILPLSSKSHWDVPISIDGRVVHVLASHPTPPVFDGPEDRNGRRNHDEIRFWAEYVGDPDAAWIRDDRGGVGGLPAGAAFVILGDLNSDPHDGDASASIRQLLEHPRVRARHTPESLGGIGAAATQGGANRDHRGDPAHDTGDFPDDRPGNLRLDYVLPSVELHFRGGAVFWPPEGYPLADVVGCSDHRLVWVDVVVH